MKIRFSIRDLLWLVVVAALAVAWWLDRRAIGIQRDAARATIVQLQGKAAALEKNLATIQQRLKWKIEAEQAAVANKPESTP
jgi:hypothetical protein